MAECFEKETTIRCNKIIDPANARASEENGCDTWLCLPPDATAEDVTQVSYTAGEVEGLEELTFDLECIDANRPIANDRNESYGAGEMGEQSMDRIPPHTDVDEGDHAIEAEDEFNAPLISEESIAERIVTVAYANANTTRDYAMN